jgi:hypothetical protein
VEDAKLALLVETKYHEEEEHLRRLADADGISPGEAKRISQVRRMAQDFGGAMRRSPVSADELRALAQAFVDMGPKAVLSSGPQRGGDFLNNQLRGRWAEDVVASMRLPGIVVKAFGPSGAAMPGEENHREIVATYKEIMLLEGKRPDLLAFDEETWRGFSDAERERAESWPDHVLDDVDDALVAAASFGIEVKNSTWHYGARREAGGGPLSITVKDEEIEHIADWENRTANPVLFFQVLYDEIYVMSFSRMRQGIKNGHVYEPGDYLAETERGAGNKPTRKLTHYFFLKGTQHRCGLVEYPAKSKGRVKTLANGYVIAYVDHAPAQALDEDFEAVRRELEYARMAKPRRKRAS